jgi:predicted nucleic acid-binding protein
VILDTNALSAIADGDPAAVACIDRAPLVAIPVIVLGEFRYGIARSRYRAAYQTWLGQSLPACRVLEVSDETASAYAQIRTELEEAGTPIPVNDLWIAALCRQHWLPILSQDGHFDVVRGVRRIAW